MIIRTLISLLTLLSFGSLDAQTVRASGCMAIDAETVRAVRNGHDVPPLFGKTLQDARANVDVWMADGVLVPTPEDMAGGYSHEVHKRNFLMALPASQVYQLTGDAAYLQFLRKLLLTYAERFPTFDRHPSTDSYAPGKLFWQALNDANWLVYFSQAYAGIRAELSATDKQTIETKLLRPYAEYISTQSPQFFNRVHNHSAWGNAAVGLLALALDDDALLQRALYGLPKGVLAKAGTDNDGGRIMADDGAAGFYAQLDNAFSPDGYYAEGPYYQRYAMSPFMMFASALKSCRPKLDIFAYRDSVLVRATAGLLQLTNDDGEFYPINDAQKGMSFRSRELIFAVDAVYELGISDPLYVHTARKQGEVTLSRGGFEIAQAVAQMTSDPVLPRSHEWHDGVDGKGGGIATLRGPAAEIGSLNAVFKYGTQGMGHGHFDRLSYALYEGSREVLQDYGAARWVNIDQKGGGRYLPENQTWAKQTLAHNTVVVDRRSQFDGDTQTAEDHPGQRYAFVDVPGKYTLASAKETHAYEGVELHRTLLMLHDDAFEQPIWVDITRVTGDAAHTTDLPFHFGSQLLNQSTELQYLMSGFPVLGDDAGYQHAFLEASGRIDSTHFSTTWFTNGHFYTAVSVANETDSLLFARIGANDPAFNLRRDAFYIHRKPAAARQTYFTVLMAHGTYSPVSEIPLNPYAPSISPTVLLDTPLYSVYGVTVGDVRWTLAMSNKDAASAKTHRVAVGDDTINWTGPFSLTKNSKK